MSSSDIAVVTRTPHAPAPTPGTPNAAVEMLRAHAEVMQIAFELATKMVRTTMVPPHFRLKAEDGTAAILYGAELGLNPIQSLQQVVPVNGKPTVEARTMVALLKAKGYRFKKIENTATVATIQGWEPGVEEPETVTWTIEDAILAEFVPQIDPKTGKYALNSNDKLKGNMKYLTQPRQMLWAKACAELCRQLAPDVLLGIAYSREDMESEPEHAPPPVRATSERLTTTDPATTEPGGAGLPTMQWTGTDTPAAADDSSTPDISDAAVENPESDFPPTGDEPTVSASLAEQRRLSELLDSHGHTNSAAKRAYLSTETGRPITSATELTSQEACSLTERLALLATQDQIGALRTALANDHIHNEHEQIEWVQNNGAPFLARFDDLLAEMAETLTSCLLTAQNRDSGGSS